MKLVMAVCVTLMLTNLIFAQEEKANQVEKNVAKEILAKAQGKWETTIGEGERSMLSVKEIKDNKETVSRYRDDELLTRWTVDFEITQANGLNIFTYRNMTHTHGPNKGRVNKGPFSYVFKIQGDEWHEVHGLIKGDSRKPSISVYKRPKKNSDE